MNNEQPYILKEKRVVVSQGREYNPSYGDERKCRCGHTYYRHFDTYENMRDVGCKYCDCGNFQEAQPDMKRALIFGGASFIGSHLAKLLKSKGYWVRCADIKRNQFMDEKEFCDDFQVTDLREKLGCEYLFCRTAPFDEIYQLAADMGGIGYIANNSADIMSNNVLVNSNVLHTVREFGFKGKYFFASSVYVYPNTGKSHYHQLTEWDAGSSMPANEYGLEKLYTEIMVKAFADKCGFQPRIARLENVYGPFGVWQGGKERAPAALCRKIAMIKDGGEIEVWGDGTAIRSFAYVEDIVEGIYKLVQSDIDTPVNIGSSEYIDVNCLVNTIAKVAGKTITMKHINGPVGSELWNFSKEKIKSTGWECKHTLEQGMAKTYPWIEEQVRLAKLEENNKDKNNE